MLDSDLATMRSMAARVSDVVTAHLASLREQPVRMSLTRTEAESLIGEITPVAPERGMAFDAVIAELEERVLPYHAREPHPRFLGYVPSIPTFASVMGDWLAIGYDFFAGVWPIASGPNEIELVVLDWFRQWLGLPAGAAGLLTSGGSTATLMAVVAARHARAGEDTAMLPKLVLYASTEAHSAVARAAWIAGIPRANVRALPPDENLSLRADAVRAAIAADREAGLVPFFVAATAGTTSTGAVDELRGIATVCADERLWMHVDAAYAGCAAITVRGKALLSGVERADSVVIDPHKWLFVPFECGCLLVRDPALLKAAFHIIPAYLRDVQPGAEEVNFADYGEQLTRYARALKIWVSVRTHGLAALRDAVEHGMRLAEHAERSITRSSVLELLTPAQFGVVCFRAHPKGTDDPAALDALNRRLNTTINDARRFLMSSTTVKGAFALRLCTHNYRTQREDLDELLGSIEAAARGE